MDVKALLSLYDANVRANPAPRPGRTVVREDNVLRLADAFNFVTWWDFPASAAEAVVARYATSFHSKGETLIWRVHDHDQPSVLPDLLAAAGFRANPPGTLMFLDLERQLPPSTSPGAEVRRVADLAGLDDFVAAADKAFGDTQASDRRDAYAAHLDCHDVALFVAYVAGEPVASARLETAPGQAFGQLYGGGVAPSHRGVGAYRALVAARVSAARAQGLSFLSTEARETSRPILQHLGFIPAVGETTWVLSPELARRD